jgi:molybdopterin adenylyltransferase
MARLLLFATARETAGCRQAEITATSLGQALELASERFGPPFERLLRHCTTVVDEVVVPSEQAWETPVGHASEIAVLPPVSGGSGPGGHTRPRAATGPTVRVAVLTVSDRSAAGERQDGSGPAVEHVVEQSGWEVVARGVVPDEPGRIQSELASWSQADVADVILTPGGTGLGPRDVTPEATRAVLDREVPGIPELMRAAGARVTPHAALSRQVAGQRGRTLIVNLPGSPQAATECLQAVLAILPHAMEVTRGRGPS